MVPYTVKGVLLASGEMIAVFSEHATGVDFYLNAGMLNSENATRIRKVLRDALDLLEKEHPVLVEHVR